MSFRAKPVRFRGSELDDLQTFPRSARRVREIRIRDSDGTFRVIYVAKFEAAVYVLHCFQKKTQATAKTDIDLAATRYRELMKELEA